MPTYHEGFTHESKAICSFSAGWVHCADHTGHYGFNASQRGSAYFTFYGNGQHGNVRGSSGSVDGLFDR